jgi:hypothetical protein
MVCSSETLVSTYKSKKHYNPQDQQHIVLKIKFYFCNYDAMQSGKGL